MTNADQPEILSRFDRIESALDREVAVNADLRATAEALLATPTIVPAYF